MCWANKLYLGRTHEYTKTTCLFRCWKAVLRWGVSEALATITAGFGDVGFSSYWTLQMFCVQPIHYSGVKSARFISIRCWERRRSI